VELRQAHYVLAVVDHGGFGRAAEALHIVQSAVSQQVARLERELGVTLFDRTRRTPVLTPAGERFVPAARALVEAERAALMAVRGGPARRVGIGAGRRMRELVPDDAEAVRLGRTERVAALRRGGLDAALVHGEPTSEPDLVGRVVGSSELVVVLPAADPAPEVLLAALAGRPLVLTGDDPRSPIRQVLGAHGLGAETRPVAGDITDLLAAVAGAPGSWSVVFRDRAEGFRPESYGVVFRQAGLEVPIVELRCAPAP
jgi:DNA-binding transcriptional LysR family regulator